MSRNAVIAIAGVVAVVAVAGALLIAGVGTATADEVRFENVADPGRAPFTAPTDVASATADAAAASSPTATNEGAPTKSADPSAGGGSGSESSGETGPRTFGAAGSGTVCDREQLASELARDPEKLSAWAEVAGVDGEAQTVADYIRELRPSTLTQDTQVTNHSFVDGSAGEFQAILAKGTAVLVDEEGDPVVRCRAGSPLAQPASLEAETRCVNCPANYRPPPPCEGRCHRPDPDPPSVTPKGTPPALKPTMPTPTTPTTPPPTQDDPVLAARTALNKCRLARGNLGLCAAEYETARSQCSREPLNPVCDSTVCWVNRGGGSFGRGTSEPCESYLGSEQIKRECKGSENVLACESNLMNLRDLCAVNPIDGRCQIAAEDRAAALRNICFFQPSQPGCKSVQLGCVKDPSGSGCKALQNKCISDPTRADCKAASEVLQKCEKEPNLPECRGLDPKKAPAALLRGGASDGQIPDGQKGDGGTGEDAAGAAEGEAVDPDSARGGTPSAGEGTDNAPPTETPPAPEGQ